MFSVAPIILFAYNRPNHIHQVIESLLANKLANESDLFVYSDGAKNSLDQDKVSEVRKYIHTITGFKSLTIIEHKTNLGLANNIMKGVTDIVDKYGSVIVLEDDIIVSPFFLEYMNMAMQYYADNKKICSISGSCFLPSPCKKNHGSHVSRLTSSWGWATWKDRWNNFQRDNNLLHTIINNKKLYSDFNYDQSYDYIKIAQKQIKGKINSWAIYWYAYNFIQHKLTVYPNTPLIFNIGFDGSGSHCKKTNIHFFSKNVFQKYTVILQDYTHEDSHIRTQISNSIRQENKIKQLFKTRPLMTAKIKKYFNMFKLWSLKKNIGKNTLIAKSARIVGWESINIGQHSIIGENCWINVNNKLRDSIVIGSYCYLGPNTFLNSGQQIVIQDYSMLAIGSKVIGSNHNINNPFEPYISTGISNHQKTIIGYNVWLGADAKIIGSVTIGYGSIIGAGSVVTHDIPPFSIAVGNPAQVVKRYDFEQACWIQIDQYNLQKNQHLIPTEEEYLKILQNTQVSMPYLAAGKEMGDIP